MCVCVCESIAVSLFLMNAVSYLSGNGDLWCLINLNSYKNGVLVDVR